MADQAKIAVTLPVIDCDSREEIVESNYQVRWSQMMDKWPHRNSSLYKGIKVLMLRWADKYDNLNITGEVEKLKDVFENDFGYNVTIEHLNKKEDLQVEVNLIVARWIHEHNAPDTLLIVYYAGHGKPGVVPGELRFQGYTSPNDQQEKGVNYIIWNKTEELLKAATKPDVLQIFDCCYAGYLGLTRDGTRTFEYIAATQHDKTTPIPGKTSFTSALIWALRTLRRDKLGGRFTTAELLRQIKDKAPHFPPDQQPELYSRENACTRGRIMLHPLDGDSPRSSSAEPEPNQLQELARRHTLTLHFELSENMDVNAFEVFTYRVNEIFERNTFGVNSIRWGGIRPSSFARAVKRFQNSARERRLSLATEQAQQNQIPLTPTSIETNSPAMLDVPDIILFQANSPDAIESSQEAQDISQLGKRSRAPWENSETSELAGQYKSGRKRSRTAIRGIEHGAK